MPQVTVTLTDSPDGSLEIHSSMTPSVGQPLSNAQAAALEIVTRTRRQWGICPPEQARLSCTTPEVLCRDILDPERLGHAVSPEVRHLARVALGLPPVTPPHPAVKP